MGHRNYALTTAPSKISLNAVRTSAFVNVRTPYVTGLHVGWWSTIGVVHTREGVPYKLILEHSECINC